MSLPPPPPVLSAPELVTPHCRHGFLTREGGVSKGIYAGLNCGPGSGDDAAAVEENRNRALELLGIPNAEMLTVYQTHSADVVTVKAPFSEAPKADAMVTQTPGLALGILTADCAPVLLLDAGANVIAALHAGWKGALGGIVTNTVDAMVALGAQPGNVRAVIGPCIAQRSYEVGAELRDKVVDAFPNDALGNGGFFEPSSKDGHWQFDLGGFVAARLTEAGINRVASVGADTYDDEGRFYSFRRATHRGETDYGRQLSLIALRGTP